VAAASQAGRPALSETDWLSTVAMRSLLRHGIALAQRVGQDLHGLATRLTPAPAGHAGALPDRSELAPVLARAESALADDVLPFWTRDTWDDDAGGFITHLDRTGRRAGPTGKCLVAQAGTIWSLAAAHRHGLDGRGYLDLARGGVRFLLEKMWDAEHGGFVWEIAGDGRVVEPRTDTCGQAIAISALTEYALASGDDAALATASALFDILHERPADERKTLLTHLHLMASFALLTRATGASIHAAALEKVRTLLVARGAEAFDSPTGPLGRTVASYGLNVQAAWLMLDAADALGAVPAGVREKALALVDHALACGFDWRRGGLARYGPPRGHVVRAVYLGRRRLDKVWWAQAELLVAALEAHRLTGAARYLDAFRRQADWIWTRQADREAGGWFEATTWREGRPLGFAKGDGWRCPFHETRALIRVSRALRAMGFR
jgi:mannose/cellobiose epimerase-like protein (N-acyl-D-glucosamine 2-epimerase family)